LALRYARRRDTLAAAMPLLLLERHDAVDKATPPLH